MSLDDLSAYFSSAPVDEIGTALYGRDWRTFLIGAAADGSVRFKSSPLPETLGNLLEPHLRGVYAHDGREHPRDARSAWWSLDESPTAVATDQIGDAISSALSAVEDTAREARAEYVPLASSRAGRDWMIEAAHRAALIRAVREANRSRGALPFAVHGLRSRLRLDSAALDEIARKWLVSALEYGEIPVQHSGRILCADVEAARAADPDALPKRALWSALSNLLGKPLRAREWPLTPELLALLEGPEATESAHPEQEIHE